MLVIKRLFLVLLLILIGKVLIGAPLTFVPIQLKQPDGSLLNVYASGDEFYNWVHDKDNFTIIPNPKTGYYVYASFSNGKLIPTDYVVGKAIPTSVGLTPGINVFPNVTHKVSLAKLNWDEAQSTSSVAGSRYNLVVFIRFKNEIEISDFKSKYELMLNSVNGPSLKHYYNETSNGILDVVSTIYPEDNSIVSYEDIQDRNYYLKYDATTNPTGYKDSEKGTRESSLLRRALDFVAPQIPASTILDGNGDGNIDNVIFIVSGGAAGWSDLIWPHMSSLASLAYKINGKKVGNYNFQLQKSVSWPVLNHEMGHTLGMPDLYRYNDKTINPVGGWDLMASNNIYMCNYMKWKYLKWISSIPEITEEGTYWLKKTSATSKNVYKIKSPRSMKEYFLLEYRDKEGLYESNLPGTGLVVYRINEKVRGNSIGPPDEIYYYRPGGTLSVNGILSQANFGSNYNRTQIDDNTSPSSFLSDGYAGGLKIKNIGIAGGDSISFDVEIVKNLVVKNDYTVEKTTYNWIDISKTGTQLNSWMNATASQDSSLDDGYSSVAIPIGFDFTFYNNKFNSIYVGINGLVSFSTKFLNVGSNGSVGSPSTFGYFNQNVTWPGNSYFNNSIAASYNDYDLNKKDSYGGGRILYQTIGEKFILSWQNVGSFETKGDTTNTFQLILDGANQSILINYKNFNLAATRNLMKIGIQKDLTNGIGWIDAGDFPDRIPSNNSSVKFYPTIPTIIEEVKQIPSKFSLEQNYPNPFNPITTISYKVHAASHVTLKVFDLLGREVVTIVNEEKAPGNYQVEFNSRHLERSREMSSGVYFYQMKAGHYIQSKKMVVLK